MTLTKQQIDDFNTGTLKPQYAKNTIHYFCATTEKELDDLANRDIVTAVRRIVSNLALHSADYTEEALKDTSQSEFDILEPFFDQKNQIPIYLYFLA